MYETKSGANSDPFFLTVFKSICYGTGFAAGGAAIIFLVPGLRETLVHLATTCFG